MKIAQVLFALLVVGLMVVAGCSNGQTDTTAADLKDQADKSQQEVPQVATGNAEVDEVGSEIVEIDGLDEDLSSDDLDALDAELADLDW